MDQQEECGEERGLVARVKSWFGRENEEETSYKRKLMDRKIERYLDANFDAYIEEYGMIREIDLLSYDERHGMLVDRVRALKEFVQEAEGEIGGMERRLDKVRKIAKPKGG